MATHRCAAGCGAVVPRAASRCVDCRRVIAAARARVARGSDVLPVLPAQETQRVADGVDEALEAATRLDAVRRRVEHIDAQDAVTLEELTLWLTPILAHLEEANRALSVWRAETQTIRRTLDSDTSTSTDVDKPPRLITPPR